MSGSIHRLHQAQLDYRVMLRHCQVAKSGLQAEVDSLHDLMDRDLNSMSEFSQDAYLGNINDYYIETAETLPRLQWYAQLLIVYGYFEKTVNDVCYEISREGPIEVSLKDIYGQGIVRAKTYLTKIAGVRSPFEGESWSYISKVASLRNVVAHRAGIVELAQDQKDSEYCRLEQIPEVTFLQETIDQKSVLVIFDDQLVINLITAMSVFTNALVAELKGANHSLQARRP